MRPAVRDGVGASSIVLPPGAWPHVLAFLCAQFPDISPEIWTQRIARALVLFEDGTPIAMDTPYRAGTRLHYYRELESEPEIPFEAEVLFRDEHLLIADKPHFLPVVPSGRFVQQCLLVRLKHAFKLDALVPLHRIDRGTAGVVAFSLNPASRGRYQRLFPRREVLKEYEALAPHRAELSFPLVHRSRLVEGEPFFRMREVAGEPNSETRIELAQRRGGFSLYRLHPHSGRKHQLRVHLAGLGLPIVNDSFYPELRDEAADDFTRPLQLLARALEFDDPLSGARRRFESRRVLGGSALP